MYKRNKNVAANTTTTITNTQQKKTLIETTKTTNVWYVLLFVLYSIQFSMHSFFRPIVWLVGIVRAIVTKSFNTYMIIQSEIVSISNGDNAPPQSNLQVDFWPIVRLLAWRRAYIEYLCTAISNQCILLQILQVPALKWFLLYTYIFIPFCPWCSLLV